MFFTIRDNPSGIPWCLHFLTWITAILLGSGIVCNTLVMWANNGKMPVAMQKEDILFVINLPLLRAKHFPSAGDFDERHQALTKDAKFPLLADRIPFSFNFSQPSKSPSLCTATLNALKIPVDQEGIASIGDLLIWPGMLLALFNVPVLLFWIVWKILLSIRRKT